MWLCYCIDVRISKWLVATCGRQGKMKCMAMEVITLMTPARALIKRQWKWALVCIHRSTKMAWEIKWIRARGGLGRVLVILDSIAYYSLILIQTVHTTSTSLWWPDPRRIQARAVFPFHFQIKTPLGSSNPHRVELLMKYLALFTSWKLEA